MVFDTEAPPMGVELRVSALEGIILTTRAPLPRVDVVFGSNWKSGEETSLSVTSTGRGEREK